MKSRQNLKRVGAGALFILATLSMPFAANAMVMEQDTQGTEAMSGFALPKAHADAGTSAYAGRAGTQPVVSPRADQGRAMEAGEARKDHGKHRPGEIFLRLP